MPDSFTDLPLFEQRPAFPTAEAALEALAVGNSEWIAQAKEFAVTFCAKNGEVSTDDLWRHFPPPQGVKGQILGAVMKDRRLKHTGQYRKSERDECHRRPIAVYVLRNPAFPLTHDPLTGFAE